MVEENVAKSHIKCWTSPCKSILWLWFVVILASLFSSWITVPSSSLSLPIKEYERKPQWNLCLLTWNILAGRKINSYVCHTCKTSILALRLVSRSWRVSAEAMEAIVTWKLEIRVTGNWDTFDRLLKNMYHVTKQLTINYLTLLLLPLHDWLIDWITKTIWCARQLRSYGTMGKGD